MATVANLLSSAGNRLPGVPTDLRAAGRFESVVASVRESP